jgi:hypothetical protein
MLIINQREQEMLKRGIFMATRCRSTKRIVQGCFKFTGKRRHFVTPYRGVNPKPNIGCPARLIKGKSTN